MKRMSRLLLGLLLVGFILPVPSALAQGYKATVTGEVSDPSGASIPGARVTAVHVETNISTTTVTGDNGNYVIPQLVPGGYRLVVEALGFKTFQRAPITLQVDQATRIDVRLEIGIVTEAVLVTNEASPIDTEKSSLGAVVSNREIVDIPLNGRNYLSLALLAPGVVPAPAGANPHNINGSRSDHVNYLLDGVSNINRRGNEPVVTPSIDAIQEFKIITNSFSAEYGRLGGGVISVALKGGTNEFHGSVFEFIRNDKLDARGFFDPEVPKLKRNQFGGVIGGPIVRDRTFFLFSYEGLRNRQEQTRLTRVPTLQERAGIFATPLRHPITRQPFPNNTIPSQLISPIALNILAFVPEPNRTGALNYITVGSIPNDSNSYIFKIDHHVSGSDHISGRYLLNDTKGANPFRSTPIPGFGASRENRNQQLSLSYTHTFSPTLINEARFGYLRSNFAEESVNAGRDTAAEVGIPGVASGVGLTNIFISGFPEFGDAVFLPDRWTDNEYVLSNMVTLISGSHNIRFGGHFQRSQHFNLFAAFSAGQIAFVGAFSGNAFGDFLLGLPAQTQRQVGTNKSYLFGDYFGFFFQDDWKVRRNLTLNLGVRYDVNKAPVEKFNHWANFIPSERQQILAGTPGYPRALMRTDYNNISPRVGFAYTPFGDTKTVIRGGYGIFNSFDLQFTMYQLLGATAFPFTRLELYQAIAVGNPSLADPFPSNRPGLTPGALSPNGWTFDNPTSYFQNWNFSIAREITANLGLEVSYVGTKGTHQSSLSNVNQTIRTPQGNIVPFPGLGRVLVQGLGANSSYNALQISLQRRFSRHFGFRSNFTWSKSIDNASFGNQQAQNPRDLAAERGLSDFDRRRVWSNDFVYELPFGRERKFGRNLGKLLDAFLGGWQVNGIILLYDGRPFTPVVSNVNAQAGFATRPDRIGSGEVNNPTIDRWFDPTAFTVVPANQFRFGNSGRNILIGPGAIDVNASLFKEFSMPWESHRLQFRAEFFNLPNHPNFGQPLAAIDQPTAGIIGSAGPGRQIQFALKYLF